MAGLRVLVNTVNGPQWLNPTTAARYGVNVPANAPQMNTATGTQSGSTGNRYIQPINVVQSSPLTTLSTPASSPASISSLQSGVSNGAGVILLALAVWALSR